MPLGLVESPREELETPVRKVARLADQITISNQSPTSKLRHKRLRSPKRHSIVAELLETPPPPKPTILIQLSPTSEEQSDNIEKLLSRFQSGNKFKQQQQRDSHRQ